MDDPPTPDASSSEVNPLLGAAAGDDDVMSVDISRQGGAVMIAVEGDIDLLTAARLSDALNAGLAEAPDVLVVDLDQVSFLTSVGLTALALAQRAAREQGVDLRVVATSRTTLRPLQITGMTEELAVYGSRRDALAGCSGGEERPVSPPRTH